MIPGSLKALYPNPVLAMGGAPVVVFRDHRWTLPVVHIAVEQGLVATPVPIVMFDRHRDSLPSAVTGAIREYRTAGTLDGIISLTACLSPRDDDWIIAGMEAGLISDVVQFRSERDDLGTITCHRDASGKLHRIFHLGLPGRELSYKGALADPEHEAASEGLWEVMGWNPRTGAMERKTGGFVLDIDLDFFTISWETYTIPFPEEVYRGEFFEPRESPNHAEYPPVTLIRALSGAAGVITVACEPDFCGGERNARRILEDVNRYIFESALDVGRLRVDYEQKYPSGG